MNQYPLIPTLTIIETKDVKSVKQFLKKATSHINQTRKNAKCIIHEHIWKLVEEAEITMNQKYANILRT